MKKAQEIWDDFTTGKQKRHRIQEEQEKKRQQELALSNQLAKSIKKKCSKVSMADQGGNADNKADRKSNRLSSSEDEAVKDGAANISTDKKDGGQSERSSKVNISLSEKKAGGHGQPRNQQFLSPHRTSYNADNRQGKGDNPFSIAKQQVQPLEKVNSGLSQ